MIKPGKVSKDYISGKRSRYSNPFRFYLSVSIFFFIIIGLTKKYNEFQAIDSQNNTTTKKDSIEISKALALENEFDDFEELNSLKSQIQKETGLFNKMMSYHKNTNIDESLDSLKIEKNFVIKDKLIDLLKTYANIHKRNQQYTLKFSSTKLFTIRDGQNVISKEILSNQDWFTLKSLLPDNLKSDILNKSFFSSTFNASLHMAKEDKNEEKKIVIKQSLPFF